MNRVVTDDRSVTRQSSVWAIATHSSWGVTHSTTTLAMTFASTAAPKYRAHAWSGRTEA
jgi:hypothetical protein